MKAARLALFLPVILAVATACPRKPAPAPSPSAAADSAAMRARQDSINAADAARRDSIDAADRARMDSARFSAERERERAAAAAAAAAAMLRAPVYFEYDQDELSSDARVTLDAKLPYLSANASVKMRLVGHTDSRGSDEYNLALGQRRAAAVKRYLVERGIATARLEVVSMGEEQPASSGDDESEFGRNRRVEFELATTSGAPGQ